MILDLCGEYLTPFPDSFEDILFNKFYVHLAAEILFPPWWIRMLVINFMGFIIVLFKINL